ncbi:MAG: TetR/AcrR family transcriptional regulator [Capsulimonas sp.]|uniref:TetR/AcrR family transcriptional regulator n=1 Tax=Capsulimonas sp. TaxID=2494211 RepID=UPI003266213C
MTDKRVERSKAAVLAETYRQLSQSGISGLSIDEVSRISGVSKMTIYRHWPSRSALVIDACSRLGIVSEPPNTGSLREDVRVLATDLADQLRTGSWTSIYPSIIDAAERDPDIAAMQSELHKCFMKPFHTVVERAKDRREAPLNMSADELIATIIGPLFFRRWFSKEVVDDRFVNLLIATAFHI